MGDCPPESSCKGRLSPSFRLSLEWRVLLFLASPPPSPPFSHLFPLLLLKRQNDLKASGRRQGGSPMPALPGRGRPALCGQQCSVRPEGSWGALVWKWMQTGPTTHQMVPFPPPGPRALPGIVDHSRGGIQLSGTCLLKPGHLKWWWCFCHFPSFNSFKQMAAHAGVKYLFVVFIFHGLPPCQ